MKKSAALRNICVQNNIGNWWDWWHTRRFHIVPAYRGFNLPGINLAEIGHSTMRVPVLMSLAVAAWCDMCTMVLQDTEYDALINNKAKVSGKGLNLKAKKTERMATGCQICRCCIGSHEQWQHRGRGYDRH